MKVKVLVVIFLMLVSLKVSAHALDMGYLEINYSSETRFLDINLDVNPSALKNNLDLRKLIYLNQCKWSDLKSEVIASEKMRLSGKVICLITENDLKISFIYFDNLPMDYQIVGRLVTDENESTFLMNRTNSSVIINAKEQKTFLNFIMMGIEHIGVTSEQWHNKLPEGIDHILFVLALVLLGGGLKSTVKIVSGFTIGHSISLILAGFNLITIPGYVIEPMIAISIVYVSVEALIIKKSSHRWIVALIFGVIHGFGFASALRDLHLTGEKLISALIGFNLGVEFGQIVIILLILPILYLLALRPIVFNYTSKSASIMIAIIGSYWFVVRVFS
jgi:hypothetical protein